MGREAPGGVILMSELLGLEVRDDAGARLGRVHDLRVVRRGERYEVEGLLVGRGGVAARLGLRPRSRDLVEWSDVRALGPDAVTVSSAPRRRPAADPGSRAGSRRSGRSARP